LATRHLAEQLFRSFRRMFGKVVVAAKERRYYFAMLCQCLLQRAAGPGGSLFESGTDVGLLFSADLCEKLVQVVNNANFFAHEDLLSRRLDQPVYVISREAPTWLMAPTISPTQSLSSLFAAREEIPGLVLSGLVLSKDNVSPPMTRSTGGKVIGSRVNPGVTSAFTLSGTKVMPVSG